MALLHESIFNEVSLIHSAGDHMSWGAQELRAARNPPPPIRTNKAVSFSLGWNNDLLKHAWIKTVTKWSHKILDQFPCLATAQRQAPVLALELGQTDLQATYPINPMTIAPQSASTVAPRPGLLRLLGHRWWPQIPFSLRWPPDLWTPLHPVGSRLVVQQANWRNTLKAPCHFSATRQRGQAPDLRDFWGRLS